MDLRTPGGEDQATENPAAHFVRAAAACRQRDLQQLFVLVELVREISELVHALQKERGSSSIFLGSNGGQFAQQLRDCVGECGRLEQAVRARLEHIDEKLDRLSSGARFYSRVALAFRALDTLPGLRGHITSLDMAPQDSVKAFTEVIGGLLAVGFEVGDIAADAQVSRALIALVNFAQGKEYAGQERATAGAALSGGRFRAADRRRLQHLIAAQEESLRIFAEFADRAHVDAFNQALGAHEFIEVARMRQIAADTRAGEAPELPADLWYRHTTRRIDTLKAIEDRMSAALGRLCATKLAEARSDIEDGAGTAAGGAACAGVLPSGVDPALDALGREGGVGLYALGNAAPQPMRSILHVIQAQSRRIENVSAQLESARLALAERKVIERAKGLLMSSRRLGEKEAYTLMRDTAMQQNRRIFEIAEAIVSMAEMLDVPGGRGGR